MSVLATLLLALPLREAVAADPGALGDLQVALDKLLHRQSASQQATTHQAASSAAPQHGASRLASHRTASRLVATTTIYRQAQRSQSVPDRFNRPVLGPLAFVQFCLHYPEECKARGRETAQRAIALTQARLIDLLSVNRAVNQSIEPRPNDDVLHAEWHIAPAQGDCNDYAVTKRHELLARGWPSSALLLAEVVLTSNEHHLVLLARTREADLVLDNLHSEITTVAQSHYRWVRMQQQDNPNYWLAFDIAHPRPDPGPMASAF